MANALHLLEGRWIIRGTTFPLWLSQKRHNPTIKYEKLENDPLQFLDIVNYQNAKGQTKEIIGIDTYKQNHFIWRGRGLLRFLSSKWSVLAVTDIILVIKFERSLVTPAGIDVLARENTTLADPKQLLSTSLAQYALTVNEFDRLVWL